MRGLQEQKTMPDLSCDPGAIHPPDRTVLSTHCVLVCPAPDAQKRAKTTSSRRQPRRAQPERGVDIIDERTGKTIKYTGDLVTSPDRVKSGRGSERCMRMRTPGVGPEEEGADEEGAA